MMRVRWLIGALLVGLAYAVPASAQYPGTFSTIQTTGTTPSASIGCAIGTTSYCSGTIEAGSERLTAALATDGGSLPTHGIHLPSAVPSDTSMILYNNAGTLTFNGVALATGSSVSGTTNTMPIYTASNAIGNSLITASGSVYTMTGTWNVSTGEYRLNGTAITTGGTLTNFAYLDQANYFTSTSGQRFKAGIAVDDATASTHGIAMASAVPGSVITNLFNNANVLTWQGAAGSDVSAQLGSAPTANANAALYFVSSNANTNWRLGSNITSNAVTWTPSTDGGGTTFTTPVMTLSNAGAMTILSGLTAGSGAVGIIGTTGKIPALTATYFTSVDASTLTGISGSNISSGLVGLSVGGTAANLTASTGGIVYSGASAMAILSGTATANKVLMSGASAAPVWSTPTYPNASATAGKLIISDGTNYVASTPAYPNASVTAGKIVISDGTNYIASTPTYPNAAPTAGTFPRGDGANFLTSTLVLPNAATSTQVCYSTASNTVGCGSSAFTFDGTTVAATKLTVGTSALTINGASQDLENIVYNNTQSNSTSNRTYIDFNLNSTTASRGFASIVVNSAVVTDASRAANLEIYLANSGSPTLAATFAAGGNLTMPLGASFGGRGQVTTTSVAAPEIDTAAVNGGSGLLTLQTSGNLNLSVTSSISAIADVVCTDSSKNVIISAAATCVTSSERFKHDIQSFNGDALALIAHMQPVTYLLNVAPERGHYLGVIAERINELDFSAFPPDFTMMTRDGEGKIAGFQYEALTTLNLRGIQQLKSRVETLEAAIAVLQQR